ncbi:alpha/beta hydrolase fold-domain-containing protein [Macrophomina phaseolina]|nr:alpha/beta hydrolase fold-domain-containing protein [Macrophomina phaseolina]
MRDGYSSQIRVHKPKNCTEHRSPLVVLMHAGGFLTGNNAQLSSIARALVALYSATVLSISYRLAPAHPFPAAAHDAWDSISWAAIHSHTLGADPDAGFVIAGGSAGANLAAVVTQKAVNEKLSPPPTGAWLSVPLLLDDSIVPEEHRHLWLSRKQNPDALFLNNASLEALFASYKPDVRSPEFSPFNAPDAHEAMPPTYIEVCGGDPLRDDGMVYERMLRDHGVETLLEVYPGVPHGFVALPGFEPARKAFVDGLRGFGKLLGINKTEEELEAVVPDGILYSLT